MSTMYSENNQHYIYNGKQKAHNKPKPSHSEHLCEFGTFIIYGGRFVNGMKTQGNPLLWLHEHNPLIEYQLNCINYICAKPEIIVIGGFEFEKLSRFKRRTEYKLIENVLYDLSNTALDLRFALNISSYNNVHILDSTFIPNVPMFRAITKNPNESQILVESDNANNNIGVHVNSNNIITSFSYMGVHELSGYKYLSPLDTLRLKKIVVNPYFVRTKYDFEMLDTLKIRTVLNEFETINVARK